MMPSAPRAIFPNAPNFFRFASDDGDGTVSSLTGFIEIGKVSTKANGMTSDLIKRSEAAARGLVRYFSGDPCSRGHVAERRVVGNRCLECHRLAARAKRAKGATVGSARAKGVTAVVAQLEEWPSLDFIKKLFTVESLQAAMARGQKRYFTGIACAAGHFDQRNIANQKCVACDRSRSSGGNRSRALELWNAIRVRGLLEAALPEWPRITQAAAAERGVKRFFDGAECKAGHIGPRYTGNGECVTCSRMNNRVKYAIDPEFRQRRIDYEIVRNRREVVRATRLIKAKEYNARPTVRARLIDRLKTDPLFRSSWNIGCLLRTTLRKHSHKKSSRLQTILGCSMDEFRAHISKQFIDGMNWSNYGKWEFDHIVPLSSAKCGEDVIALFHHTNLRPLYRGPNRSKGAKRVFLI